VIWTAVIVAVIVLCLLVLYINLQVAPSLGRKKVNFRPKLIHQIHS
jgi:O-antigen/teichoic acid export membrane protein